MACLNTAGRGAMKNVQDARIKKTIRVFKDRKNFMAQLADEITKAVKSAARKEMQVLLPPESNKRLAMGKHEAL